MANLIMAIHGWWRARRQRAALLDDLPDDRCVACDSADLLQLAPKAYRCQACGYEGGAGQQAMADDAHARALAAIPAADRPARARALLDEACSLLSAACGTMDGATSASRLDLLGLNGTGTLEESGDKSTMHLAAQADADRARGCIRDAAALLGFNADVAGDSALPDFLTPVLDHHVDGLVGNAMAHERIANTAGEIAGLLGAAETLRDRYANA